MKKIVISFLFTIVAFFPALAQNEAGLFSMSANLSYGTDIETLGVGIRAQYFIIDKVRAVGEYKYYIDRRNWSAWEINADGHYVFGVSDDVYLYPIGGMKFARWTHDLGRAGIPGYNQKDSHDRIGINLGFGGQVSLAQNIYLQIELREELIKDYTQFVPLVGFMVQF